MSSYSSSQNKDMDFSPFRRRQRNSTPGSSTAYLQACDFGHRTGSINSDIDEEETSTDPNDAHHFYLNTSLHELNLNTSLHELNYSFDSDIDQLTGQSIARESHQFDVADMRPRGAHAFRSKPSHDNQQTSDGEARSRFNDRNSRLNYFHPTFPINAEHDDEGNSSNLFAGSVVLQTKDDQSNATHPTHRLRLNTSWSNRDAPPNIPNGLSAHTEMDDLLFFATSFIGHNGNTSDEIIETSATANQLTSKKLSKSKPQRTQEKNTSKSKSLANKQSEEDGPINDQTYIPSEDYNVPNVASCEISISDNDIIFERGGFSIKHPGNKAYRSILNQVRPAYKSTDSRKRKKELVNSIINFIAKKMKGRFLHRDNEEAAWTVIETSLVRLKISQALRDDRVGSKEII